MAQTVLHDGTVDGVEGAAVRVRITSRSACGSCAARAACGLAEATEKIVEVVTPEAARYAVGDRVTVGVQRHMGLKAVALGYVGALVVLVGVLALTVGGLGWSDGAGAAATLGAVALYYAALWLFRKRIAHTIQFTITKN